MLKGKPSWARKQIVLMQLDAQSDAIKRVLTEVELALRAESGSHALRARDSLRSELRLIEQARRETEALPSRPKMLWSSSVTATYRWATKDRMKLED